MADKRENNAIDAAYARIMAARVIAHPTCRHCGALRPEHYVTCGKADCAQLEREARERERNDWYHRTYGGGQ